MEIHDRFDEEHRLICEDCTAAYFDFCQEQADEARLDAAAEFEREELSSGIYGTDNDRE